MVKTKSVSRSFSKWAWYLDSQGDAQEKARRTGKASLWGPLLILEQAHGTTYCLKHPQGPRWSLGRSAPHHMAWVLWNTNNVTDVNLRQAALWPVGQDRWASRKGSGMEETSLPGLQGWCLTTHLPGCVGAFTVCELHPNKPSLKNKTPRKKTKCSRKVIQSQFEIK